MDSEYSCVRHDDKYEKLDFIIEDRRTLKENETVEIIDDLGRKRIVNGPCTIKLSNSKIRFLQKVEADHEHYIIIKHMNGNVEHVRGPAEQYLLPEHETLAVKKMTILKNKEVAHVHQRNGENKYVDGPAIFMPAVGEIVGMITLADSLSKLQRPMKAMATSGGTFRQNHSARFIFPIHDLKVGTSGGGIQSLQYLPLRTDSGLDNSNHGMNSNSGDNTVSPLHEIPMDEDDFQSVPSSIPPPITPPDARPLRVLPPSISPPFRGVGTSSLIAARSAALSRPFAGGMSSLVAASPRQSLISARSAALTRPMGGGLPPTTAQASSSNLVHSPSNTTGRNLLPTSATVAANGQTDRMPVGIGWGVYQHMSRAQAIELLALENRTAELTEPTESDHYSSEEEDRDLRILGMSLRYIGSIALRAIGMTHTWEDFNDDVAEVGPSQARSQPSPFSATTSATVRGREGNATNSPFSTIVASDMVSGFGSNHGNETMNAASASASLMGLLSPATYFPLPQTSPFSDISGPTASGEGNRGRGVTISSETSGALNSTGTQAGTPTRKRSNAEMRQL